MTDPGSRAPARLAAVFVPFLLLSMAWPVRGADEPVEGWSIERMDRVVEVVAGTRLEIRNEFGDVHVRIGEPERIDVHAVIQRAAEDPRRASLDAVATEAGTRLSVGFAPAAEPDPQLGWARRRVDLAVAVPPGARLRVVTETGRIEVKGDLADLEAESVTGDVGLWIEGPVRVRTERGSILAELIGESWSQPARFETGTGSIEVELPAIADARVRAETSGRLTTDYSIEVEWLTQRRKRATARLGAGGPELVLESGNGDLAILRRLASARVDTSLE